MPVGTLEAVRNLSIEFVMMALADQEVELTEADLEKHLTEMARSRTRASLASRPSCSAKIRGCRLAQGQLRLEMALDVLESKAKITEGAT